MPHMLMTMIGYLAGTLTTISFVPQLFKTWQCRSAREISYAWIATFTTGIVLWLAYGLLLWITPIIMANAVTLMLVISLLVMKLRFR